MNWCVQSQKKCWNQNSKKRSCPGVFETQKIRSTNTQSFLEQSNPTSSIHSLPPVTTHPKFSFKKSRSLQPISVYFCVTTFCSIFHKLSHPFFSHKVIQTFTLGYPTVRRPKRHPWPHLPVTQLQGFKAEKGGSFMLDTLSLTDHYWIINREKISLKSTFEQPETLSASCCYCSEAKSFHSFLRSPKLDALEDFFTPLLLGSGVVLTKANQKKKLQKLKIKFPKKHLKPQFTFVSNAAGETSKPPRRVSPWV